MMIPAAARTAPTLTPPTFQLALKALFGADEPLADSEPEGAADEVWVTGAVGSWEAPAAEVADSYADEAAAGSASVLSRTASIN